MYAVSEENGEYICCKVCARVSLLIFATVHPPILPSRHHHPSHASPFLRTLTIGNFPSDQKIHQPTSVADINVTNGGVSTRKSIQLSEDKVRNF